MVDLRNAETKPSYANLKQKSVPELAKTLKLCLKNQIYALRDSKDYEPNLDYALTKFLRKFKVHYEKYLV